MEIIKSLISQMMVKKRQYHTSTDNGYPFINFNSAQWNESGIKHYDDIPDTKVKAVKAILNGNQTELKMFTKSDPSTNIAPIFAKCYSFPIALNHVIIYPVQNEQYIIYENRMQIMSDTTINYIKNHRRY